MFVPLGRPSVDDLCVVLQDQSNQPLRLKVLESPPGQRRSDLEPLGHHGGRDELVAGHLLAEFVVGGLVEQGEVVQFVTHFPLRPFLRGGKICTLSHRHSCDRLTFAMLFITSMDGVVGTRGGTSNGMCKSQIVT